MFQMWQLVPVVLFNKTIDSTNSLASLRPSIAAEWASDKNEQTPETIGAGSGKKVWWRCAKGHEWQSTVVQRTGQESICPQCSGRVASSEYNFRAMAFLPMRPRQGA